MINIQHFSGITNDEKTIMRATADKMSKLIEASSDVYLHPENIPINEYIAMGNYAILGSDLKPILTEDSPVPEELQVQVINLVTGLAETIDYEALTASVNDGVQTAELLKIFCESASGEMVSSVSDFIGVVQTRVNSSLGVLTTQSRTLLNTMSTMLSQTNSSISGAVCSILQAFQIKEGQDTLSYDAQDFCGVNPWVSGFSSIHVANVVGTIVSSIVTVAATVMWGAVGFALTTAITGLIELFQKGWRTLEDPMDVYTRNQNAKPIFDASGFEYSDYLSNIPDDCWIKSPNIQDGLKYCFIFPGFEIHFIRTNENDTPMFVIRVVKILQVDNSGVPRSLGPDSNGDDLWNILNSHYLGNISLEEVTFSASRFTSCETTVIDDNSYEPYIFSKWGQYPDLSFILNWNSNMEPCVKDENNKLYNGSVYNLTQLLLVSHDSEQEDFGYTLQCCASSDNAGYFHNLNVLNFGRDIPGHGENITNADWFRRFYGMHKPGIASYETNSFNMYSKLNSDSLRIVYTRGDSGAFPSEWFSSSWSPNWNTSNDSTLTERLTTTLIYNLCSIGMVMLADVYKDWHSSYKEVMEYRLSHYCPWFSSDWLWYTSAGSDRGAYAIKTDRQNANAAGFVYDAIIVTSVLATTAIAVGVVKGNLKKKAFSANRAFDVGCFNENLSDKDCRWLGIKAGFWSALSGQGGGGGEAAVDSILDKFSLESVTQQVDDARYAGGSNNTIINDNVDSGIDRVLQVIVPSRNLNR